LRGVYDGEQVHLHRTLSIFRSVSLSIPDSRVADQNVDRSKSIDVLCESLMETRAL